MTFVIPTPSLGKAILRSPVVVDRVVIVNRIELKFCKRLNGAQVGKGKRGILRNDFLLKIPAIQVKA